jgi:aminotransferase EvaB
MIPLFSLESKILNYREQLEDSFKRTLSSGNVILGEEVISFEEEFAKFLDVRHCISVANGTDALRIAMLALGLGTGSQIAAVANAGFYSSTAILSIGAIPVYLDVQYETRNLNFDIFSDFIKQKELDAIVLTHLYGSAISDIKKIVNMCTELGILVIEDCAQSHGSMVDGQRTGTFGDIATFSFYPTKNLGALGDAGAIVTNSELLANNARSLRTYGWGEKYFVESQQGSNSRLDAIQAGFLRIFLAGLEFENRQRREIALQYNEVLDRKFGISVPVINSNEYVGHLYVICSNRRARLQSYFAELGIQTAIHYPVPDHRQQIIDSKIQLPVTEKLSEEVLTLPCRPDLTKNQISKILFALEQIKIN